MTGTGARLNELITAGRMTEYAELKRKEIAEGRDTSLLDQAEAAYWRGNALKELDKILKNPDIVSGNIKYGTPEYIHIDEMVVALQRMYDDTSCTFGGCSTFVHAAHGTSHLEQAVGKEGADELLRKMCAHQRVGKDAARKQRIARWVGGSIAVIVVIIVVLMWR